MTRVIRAELLRLVRRRTVVVTAAGCVLFSVVATLTVFSTAQASGTASRRAGTTLAALAGDGGGTEAFAVGAAFIGFFVFVTFITLLASEFSGGTFRALLLRDPHRLRVITGKLAGILLVAAAAVAFAEACTFVASLVVAPTRDVSTADWFSLDSIGAALRDYATVLGGVAGWAIFGATLSVIFRSVPLALGVGFAWAGPIENLTVESWQPAIASSLARSSLPSSKAAPPNWASAAPYSPPPSTQVLQPPPPSSSSRDETSPHDVASRRPVGVGQSPDSSWEPSPLAGSWATRW